MNKAIDLMNDNDVHYANLYEEALDHFQADRDKEAIDICIWLLGERRINTYRRAVVNIMMAGLVESDNLKYAHEGLRLIQEVVKEVDDDIREIIQEVHEVAKELVDDLEVQLETAVAKTAWTRGRRDTR